MNKSRTRAKPKCLRCGKCCIITDQDGIVKHCKYLVKYVDTPKTFCLIYRHRLGAILSQSDFCIRRADLKYDIPDCPYNNGSKMHPFYRKP